MVFDIDSALSHPEIRLLLDIAIGEFVTLFVHSNHTLVYYEAVSSEANT